ncbi:MAG: trans-sulfuration enzyme family protein, partial [Gemmatimonadota bacterium]
MDEKRGRDPHGGSSTRAIHAGARKPEAGAPVVPPVVQSATFFWGRPEDGALRYTRYGNNPNQELLARKLAALEGTEAAVAVGSGMAAASMTLLSLTRSGDHIVAASRLYGATRILLGEELPRRGVETTFVDPDDAGAFAAALRPETRLIYIEIPTNPALRVMDPAPVAALCAERGIPLVCDATFAPPVNFRAAESGVDVVIHSATKYLGGHSDLIAGVVAGPSRVVEEVKRTVRMYGPVLDPHAAWLLDRGIRTLDVRMERHNRNALALARWFRERPEVARVLYPGLEDHPDHETARRLFSGFGGMLSIVLRGGGAAADAFMERLETALAAPSLGGVETLVSQPRYTSHRGRTDEELAAQGIADGFVRISVGIEDVEDLIADLANALD